MELKSTLVVCLAVSLMQLCQSAPSYTDRRVSRDLDKVDGLRARLLRLQKQINDLEEESTNGNAVGEGNDVSAEVDVSRLHRPASEDRMASPRQREVQTLAKGLGEYNKDLHDLAGALTQLMNEDKENNYPSYTRENSAGEYLGDRYDVEENDKESDESEEEDDERRLRMIYNMLVQLYNKHQGEDIQMDTRASASSRKRPAEYAAPSERQDPVHIDEGSFGDFVNDDVPTSNRLPSPVEASASQIRQEVLNAVEAKLLKDLELGRHAGLSVDDIIRDLQVKGEEERQKELHAIQQQLQELQRLRSQ